MILNFFTDAGHGWLEVEHKELVKMGLDRFISHYSYSRLEKAYLEEDCDAGKYLNKLKELGISYSFNEIFHEYSPVRNYSPY